MNSSFKRRISKCEECPYKDAKPSQRSLDELAYARCTPPEDFHCHMEGTLGGYGYGDGETLCRGHWEVYHAAVKRGIPADESAGDRVYGDLVADPDFPSGIEAAVCQDITNRQKMGIGKYGISVADNPLTLKEWLQHAYEEALDQAIYLKRAIAEIEQS